MNSSLTAMSHGNEDQSAVNNLILNMTQAFNSQMIEQVVSCYEQDAMVMFEPQKGITQAEAIAATFQEWFTIKPTFSYPKGHDVFVANDIALHIAPWHMQGTAPDGSAIEQRGMSVAVLRKHADGSWKIVLDNPHGAFLLEQD